MAGRTRKSVCLNLAALRRMPVVEARPNGVARRTFLAGAATAALATTGAGRAAASSIAASALRIKTRRDRAGNLQSITIAVDSSHAWTLDVALYDGNPTLTMEERGDETILRLEGARLPGTRFEVEFEASIKQSLLKRQINFAFSKTGVEGRSFECAADFDAWVRGDAEAASTLPQADLVAILGGRTGLHDALSIRPEGRGKLGYTPSGGFALSETSAEWTTLGRSLAVAGLILGPERPEHAGTVESDATAITRIDAKRATPWRGKIDYATETGWRAKGTLKGFDRIGAEIHSPETSAVTLDGEGPFDLRALSSAKVDFKLDRARLVHFVQGESKTQALAARFTRAGGWLTFPGVSIDVGPYGDNAEALFAHVEDEEGERTYGDVQAGIRGASFELDGVVTQATMDGIEPISLLSWEESQGTVRPPTVLRPPTQITRPPVAATQQPLAISRLDITAQLKFRLAPFKIEVVRREDMLALTFEFVNMAMRTGAGGAPTVERADATKPSYIAVIFPPQSIAEAHFSEEIGLTPLSATTGIAKRPIPARLSGESRLVFFIPTTVASTHFSLKGEDGKGRNGLLDWARWRPSVTSTAISSYDSPRIRIDGSFINPIDSVTIKTRSAALNRAVLRPPDDPQGDPGLEASVGRLNGRRGVAQGGAIRPGLRETGAAIAIQQPRTNASAQLGRLAAGIDPTVVFRVIPKGRVEPSAMHTQIEMPVRVVISPTELAGWHHTMAIPEPAPGLKFALWHTRLGRRIDPSAAGQPSTVQIYSSDRRMVYRPTATGFAGPFLAGPDEAPTVRVIDATDYTGNGAPQAEVIIATSAMHGGKNVRREFPMLQRHRKELVDSMCWRGTGNGDSEPFNIENLILTPLGGYLKGEWIWRQPNGWPNPAKPELITWRHESTLGRDHYMKLVLRGFLFPTGHRATLTIISERKFENTAEGRTVAYVRTRRFVNVREPTMTFSGAEQNSLGFKAITSLTLETPILDTLPVGTPPPGHFAAWGAGVQTQDQVMLLYSGGQPVPFAMRGVDMDDKSIDFTMPCAFVAISQNETNGPRIQKLITEWEKGETGGLPGGNARRANVSGQMVAFAPGGGTAPSGEPADGNTSYPVHNMLISGRMHIPAAQQHRQDSARWKAVLFKANISAPAVQMMQGKPPTLGALHMPGEMYDMEVLQASTMAMIADEADGFDVKIPDVFKNSGFGSGNKSQIFLELVEKIAPKIEDVSKSGGIANPNMIIQGLAKGKGPIGGKINDILNGEVNPADLLDVGNPADLLDKGARLLGAVRLADLIPNPIKIDPGGPMAPYIELLMLYADGKNKPPTGATTAVKWKPPVKNWGFPGEPPLFYVSSFKAPQPQFGNNNPAEFLLEGSITTQFKGGGKPKMIFKGHMKNFRVDLISPASFLLLDFKIVGFTAEVGKPFDVEIDMVKMTFTGPLTFIQKLQDLVNGDDDNGVKIVNIDPNASVPVRKTRNSLLATNSADPGIDVYCDVDETGLTAGLTITVPSVSVGMLAIRNISFGVKLKLPFFGDPMSVRFNFCERNNTFQLAVMGVTGGGFVAFEVNIDGWMTLEAAFEVGGSLSFDIGVASGGVSIMAGIYFRLEIQGDYKQCMVEAYIRIQGNLSVLGLIRISLEFYLSLTYYSDGNRLVGTATLTVEIEILFFSISVSLTVQRQIAGEKTGGSYFASTGGALPMADQSVKFTEATSQAQWAQFCEAFA